MKKRGILLPEALKIVLAVICIVLLIYLGVQMAGIFISKGRIQQAAGSLDEIVLKSNGLKVGEQTDYLLVAPKGWYIVSFEAGNKMPECKNQFCICLCENKECGGLYSCKISNNFILLRESNSMEARTLNENIPVNLKMEGLNFSVYPVFVKNSADFTPLFFKFDLKTGEWLWSLDLEVWTKTDQQDLLVSSGKWAGKAPITENAEFIKNMAKYKISENDGKALLEQSGSRVSEGITLISVKNSESQNE